MDSSLPVAVPLPYKSRRGWLITFGVVELLIACLFLLVLLLSFFAFLGPRAARMPSGPMSPAMMMAFAGLEYGAAAAVFITGGIGSIRCRNWARILMLVVSGLWLGFGLIITLVVAFVVPAVMRQQPGNISGEMQHTIIVGMVVVMTALMVVLPAIFLFFYSRRSVKATCLASKAGLPPAPVAGESPAPGLPVPLAILGAWQAISAAAVLLAVFMRAVLVFGVMLHGAAAVLVLPTYSVLSGYSAWGIFHQKLIGWKIALGNTSFWTASALVTALRHPDMMQMLRDMGYNDPTLRIYDQFPHFLTLIWVGTLVMVTLLLVFIVYTRKFFPSEERA